MLYRRIDLSDPAGPVNLAAAAWAKPQPLTAQLEQEFFIDIWNLLDRKNVHTVFGDIGGLDYSTNPAVSEEYRQEPNHYGPPPMIKICIQVGFWKQP